MKNIKKWLIGSSLILAIMMIGTQSIAARGMNHTYNENYQSVDCPNNHEHIFDENGLCINRTMMNNNQNNQGNHHMRQGNRHCR